MKSLIYALLAAAPAMADAPPDVPKEPAGLISMVSMYNISGVAEYCADHGYVSDASVQEVRASIGSAHAMLSGVFGGNDPAIDPAMKDRAIAAGKAGLILGYDGKWQTIAEAAKDQDDADPKIFCEKMVREIVGKP